MFFKLSFAIAVFAISFIHVDSACTGSNQCLHNGFYDKVNCKCVCDPNFAGATCETPILKCETITDDGPECADFKCDSDIVEAICPKKCYCERPSIVTNFCPPCLNKGVIDKATCKCTCPDPFNGSRCQFTADPCAQDDLPECSNIDCWKATESLFFKCQRKCLCCGNKKCGNYTYLGEKDTSKCECKCMNTLIDYITNENTCVPKAADCNDSAGCGKQFPEEFCKTDVSIKALCPRLCKVC